MNQPADKTHGVPLQARKVIALVRPHLGRLLFCLLIVLVASAIQLVLPLGIQRIFDQMLAGAHPSVLHIATVVLLGIFLVRAGLGFLGQYMIQILSDRIIMALRHQLFAHMHALDLGYHQSQRVGDLLSRLGNDVGSIRNVVANLALSLIVNVFMLVGASAVMLTMNWKLGLLVLSIAPFTTLLTHLFSSLFSRMAREIQDHTAATNVIAHESLSGVEVIKGFARERHEIGNFRTALDTFMEVLVRARKIDALYNTLIGLIASGSTIAIFWFGGLQVLSGALSAGTLVAFLLYSQNITQSIGSIAQQYSSFVQAMGASRRVFEILEIEPRVEEREGATELQIGPMSIQVDDLQFHYRPGAPVIRGLSLEAPPGSTVAIVGPSGSGKSTLLKLVSRMYEATGGSIRINGRDIRDYTLESLRGAIAVVSQDIFLFGCNVRENIRYGRLQATDAEIETAAQAANAHGFILGLPQGYDTLVGERGVQLSGGQRQRIAIARALLKNAPILLLDEATSSVDSASEYAIQEAIDRLKTERTTLVVAHRLATIRNADSILVVEHGRVARRPSYSELIAGDAAHGFLAEQLAPAAESGRTAALLADTAGMPE